jgi:hypothetical protein
MYVSNPMSIYGGVAYATAGAAVVRVDLATGDVLPLYRTSGALSVPPPRAPPPVHALAADDQFLYIADANGISRVAR